MCSCEDSCVGVAPVIKKKKKIAPVISEKRFCMACQVLFFVQPLLKTMTHMCVAGKATPRVKWCDSNVCCEVLLHLLS